jgi:hypothetical protein
MDFYLEYLPENIVSKIFTYSSHPVSDLFKKSESYTMFCATYKDKYPHMYFEGDFSRYWQEEYRPMVGYFKLGQRTIDR